MQVARFADDLAALSEPADRIGIAVSGGPDSLALLILAAEACPGRIAAATVDHRLREGSRAEAEAVRALCDRLGVAHSLLVARWADPPRANIQAAARAERYALLADWAVAQGIDAVATAHHADDQAETLLMRLSRGSGIAGLGGVRPQRPLAKDVVLIRPLLKWRKAELAEIVARSGFDAVDDPANRDLRHDRARIRQAMALGEHLDPARLAASAAWLREADEALDWSTASLIAERLEADGGGVTVDPSNLPAEYQRRLLLGAFSRLDTEPPSGPDMSRALAELRRGRTTTLAGLKLEGGTDLAPDPRPAENPSQLSDRLAHSTPSIH